jgi:hypothetical protein
VDRYTAEWEQTGSIDPDEVLPALLAFSTYAATAADGARAAFEIARFVIGQLSTAATVNKAEVEARARLVIAEHAVMAAMSSQAALA